MDNDKDRCNFHDQGCHGKRRSGSKNKPYCRHFHEKQTSGTCRSSRRPFKSFTPTAQWKDEIVSVCKPASKTEFMRNPSKYPFARIYHGTLVWNIPAIVAGVAAASRATPARATTAAATSGVHVDTPHRRSNNNKVGRRRRLRQEEDDGRKTTKRMKKNPAKQNLDKPTTDKHTTDTEAREHDNDVHAAAQAVTPGDGQPIAMTPTTTVTDTAARPTTDGTARATTRRRRPKTDGNSASAPIYLNDDDACDS